MLFLAGRDRYTQRTLLRAIFDRLRKQPGCTDVRYDPSRVRPRFVLATVDPTVFLEQTYPVDTARLSVRFWYPANVGYEYYRINWIEPERSLTLGFHRDGDHPGLGPVHVQLNDSNESVDRYGATFLNDHPLAVLEARLHQLPDGLAAISWSGETPSLPKWPP